MENQKSIYVKLSNIEPSTTNALFRSPDEMTEQAMPDFVASIRNFGVIQPISVRPNPNKRDHYIVIGGERRYHGSLHASKDTIPVVIFDVDEETAFLMQVAENVHRKDIHPINEGKAYQRMLDSTPGITTKEVALKFGKSETYVLQRLKLSDLIPEISKEFLSGKLLLGHAQLLCRLTSEDQQRILKNLKDWNKNYRSVGELKQMIERDIMNDLSKAPFDRNDATLVPQAGACKLCPKRSGANLLFSDVKEKQRCFDGKCFGNKIATHLVNEVQRIIETQPETVLLQDRQDDVPELVSSMMSEHGLKALEEYDDFYTSKRDNTKKITGFWIAGSNSGTTQEVYIKKAAESKVDAESPEQIKEKILKRKARNRELDEEKVYAKILTSLKEHHSQKKIDSKLIKDEETFLWFLVWDKATYGLREELSRKLHITQNDPKKQANAFAKLTAEEKAYMLRRVMMDQYGGNHPTYTYAIIIRSIAEAYGDIDISSFDQEQKEIRNKRDARADERIKKLGLSTKSTELRKPSKSKKSKHKAIAA